MRIFASLMFLSAIHGSLSARAISETGKTAFLFQCSGRM